MAFARCLGCVVLLVVAASRLDAVPLRSHIVDLEEARKASLFEDSIPISYAEESEILQSGGELIEGDIIPSADILQLIAEEKEKEAKSNDAVGTTVSTEPSERVASRSKRGLIPSSFLWPGGVVHYTFSAELRRKGEEFWKRSYQAINKAMNMIEEKSCVRFEPYSHCKAGNPCVGNFINFMPVADHEPHCSSKVGRQLGIQPVRIGPMCYNNVGSVVHELLHSLGFYHEQSRPDRDEHVEIRWQNIDHEKNKKYFVKYSHGNVESFNVSYDLDSIMHYSNYAFSKTGKEKTIVAKNDPNKVLGQRKAMSPSDIKQLNLQYKCPPIDTIPIRCDDVNNQPLQYRQKVSMQYKARKWLSCDEFSCRRKSCLNLSDSNCSSEPTGCKAAKFSILPTQQDNRAEIVMNNAEVRIANSEELFNGKTLHCASRMEDPHKCRFDTCAPGSGEVCKSNTFTIRKQASMENAVINQNDIISLCQKESGTDNQYCLSCSRITGQLDSPCRLVSCTKNLKGCVGIFFRARQWPSMP